MKRLFLFDFDGVLFDSNKIKTHAFRVALEGFPAPLVEHFIAWHEANGGIGRKEKFTYFFSLLGEPEDKRAEMVQILTDKFRLALQELLPQSNPISGVVDFLRKLHGLGFDLGICSGGDKGEIIALLKTHALNDVFLFIKGNEHSKQEHCERISAIYDTVTFFGDAKYDYEVSLQFNFEFVFVHGVTDWKEGLEQIRPTCRTALDFSGLDVVDFIEV